MKFLGKNNGRPLFLSDVVLALGTGFKTVADQSILDSTVAYLFFCCTAVFMPGDLMAVWT
jgi:hypothetical protein